MECSFCKDIVGDREVDKAVFASCRKVLKIDIVLSLRGQDPSYLSESNRYKYGKSSRFTADQKEDIRIRHKNGESMGKLAKEYDVSKTTIFNIINGKYSIPGIKKSVSGTKHGTK